MAQVEATVATKMTEAKAANAADFQVFVVEKLEGNPAELEATETETTSKEVASTSSKEVASTSSKEVASTSSTTDELQGGSSAAGPILGRLAMLILACLLGAADAT